MSRARAPRRMTRGVLHLGTLMGGGCLAVGMTLEALARPGSTGSLLDGNLVVRGLPALDPWAWSVLGVWIVIGTPIVALASTAFEFRLIGDRRAVLATTIVLALLAVSLLVGLMRGA